jgi:hypothetical protein
MITGPKPLTDRSPAGVWLERLRQRERRNYICDSPDIRVVRSERGASILINHRNAGGDSEVEQYLLTDASAGDYFVARTLSVTIDNSDPDNPTEVLAIGAQDIYIAKPFHLRQTSFDRAVLNAVAPEDIGTADEITYDVAVEVWDGVLLTEETHRFSYEYLSATFRVVTDATDEDPDNWPTQNQTIIPRFVPAELVEENEPVDTLTIAPTILYAIECSGLGVTRPDDPELPEDEQTPVAVTLLALSDGWAWSKTS